MPDDQSDTLSEEEVPCCVLSLKGGSHEYWVTPLLDGKPVRMEVDSGAAVSLVSDSVYKEELKHLPLKATKIILKTYTGEAVPLLGTTDVKVELNGRTAELPLFVVKGHYPALMGRSWLRKIPLDWAEVHRMTEEETGLTDILKRHAAVFGEDLGSMRGITVKLNIKPGSQPKYLKARNVPYAIRPKVEADLEHLVKNGVLIPVTHSPWATPIVPILKKDGSIWICGDFKVTVNPVLCAEQYPFLASMTSLRAWLGDKALFQRAMEQTLCGLPGVQCYLDDILATGGNEEDHLKNLRRSTLIS
nr:uncharacterized protein K02A2.6-like [Pelodiscus sinensis]|eukprot:XP_025038057.1 uncharacterized protein K02A2.6-like [Pelodiscus sinensis]